MNQKHTLIQYYIPEDLDSQNTPNAFIIPKSQNEININDIINYFPLKGHFIFRFKYYISKNQPVWMDVTQEDQNIPTANGQIMIKAQRTQDSSIYQKQVKQQQNKEPQSQMNETKNDIEQQQNNIKEQNQYNLLDF